MTAVAWTAIGLLAATIGLLRRARARWHRWLLRIPPLPERPRDGAGCRTGRGRRRNAPGAGIPDVAGRRSHLGRDAERDGERAHPKRHLEFERWGGAPAG